MEEGGRSKEGKGRLWFGKTPPFTTKSIYWRKFPDGLVRLNSDQNLSRNLGKRDGDTFSGHVTKVRELCCRPFCLGTFTHPSRQRFDFAEVRRKRGILIELDYLYYPLVYLGNVFLATTITRTLIGRTIEIRSDPQWKKTESSSTKLNRHHNHRLCSRVR